MMRFFLVQSILISLGARCLVAFSRSFGGEQRANESKLGALVLVLGSPLERDLVDISTKTDNRAKINSKILG